MSAMEQQFERMSMDKLRAAAIQREENNDEQAAKAVAAARVFVERLIDLELELRLALAHERPGWHPSSPGFGDGTGASTRAVDAMFLSYLHDKHPHDWHRVAHLAMGKLTERTRLAVLIRRVKQDGRRDGWRAATYDDIADNLGRFAGELGWPRVAPLPPTVTVTWTLDEQGKRRRNETRERAFKNGQAIKWAAQQGRSELLFMAKTGAVQ